MRIRLNRKPISARRSVPARAIGPETGHSFAGVLVAAATLGVVVGTLCVPFSAVLCVVRATRENLRTTQIVMERAEALRLFTWGQVCDTNNQRQPLFVERDDARGITGDRRGAQYTGCLSPATPLATDTPNACRAHMRSVTLTLCWTNYNGAKPVGHTREIQTRLARNGAPKYIWGPL